MGWNTPNNFMINSTSPQPNHCVFGFENKAKSNHPICPAMIQVCWPTAMLPPQNAKRWPPVPRAVDCFPCKEVGSNLTHGGA
jgi:hypothetical protein